MKNKPGSQIPQPSITIQASSDWADYELIDSGNGFKLERFGTFYLKRPEPEAVWSPAISEKEWKIAHASFRPSPEENGGHWLAPQPLPERWTMSYKGLQFYIQTTASRHVGVFPEQAAQWDWINQKVHLAGHPIQVLNLFGYTGLATLAAAQAGAQVTHLDASRKVVGWARDNQSLSRLNDRPIRWMIDDALKFVQRESRRGSIYDGIILDPPKFGRGPKGEIWDFYKFIPDMLSVCRTILSPQPLFIVLTAYAIKASALTLHYAVEEMMSDKGGKTTAGELVLQEKSAGRLLSTAIFARWEA